MAVLRKADGTSQRVKPKDGKKFTLEELQSYVGGYVQAVALRDTREIIWCNEDGKYKGLPRNVEVTVMAHAQGSISHDDCVVGDVLVTVKGET